MICSKCGTEFNEGIFCPECGTKIEGASVNPPEITEEERLRIQQEEKEKREVEIEKAKAEQERMAAEKAAKDVERVKLELEKEQLIKEKRLAQEREAERVALERKEEEKRRIEEEKRIQAENERKSRTVDGVEYQSIEEANIKKKEIALEKKANISSVLCLILAIATYPLVMTIVLWFPAYIASIILGISARKNKATQKAYIAGLIIDIIFMLIIIASIVGSMGLLKF